MTAKLDDPNDPLHSGSSLWNWTGIWGIDGVFVSFLLLLVVVVTYFVMRQSMEPIVQVGGDRKVGIAGNVVVTQDKQKTEEQVLTDGNQKWYNSTA